jgi:hypothetical protein
MERDCGNKLSSTDRLKEQYESIVDDTKDYSPGERLFMQILNAQIEKVEANEASAHKWYFGLGFGGLLLSAMTTVILGLKMGDWPAWLKVQPDIALVISGISTLVVGYARLRDSDDYYFRIKAMLNNLKLMRYRYVMALMARKDNAKHLSPEELGDFEQQLRAIIGDGYWEGRGKEDGKDKMSGVPSGGEQQA